LACENAQGMGTIIGEQFENGVRSTKDEKKEITYSLQRIKIQERKKT
jgi:hypothetical protein